MNKQYWQCIQAGQFWATFSIHHSEQPLAELIGQMIRHMEIIAITTWKAMSVRKIVFNISIPDDLEEVHETTSERCLNLTGAGSA